MLMKRIKWFYLIALIAVAIISIFASPVFAENKGITKEGVNVHGHWKIEIFNPDGTRASVTEFDNALVDSTYLIVLTRGTAVHSSWGIELDSTATDPCDDGAGGSEVCRIGESGANYGSITLHSSNLLFSPTGTGFELSGSVTASYSSTINNVTTASSFCLADTTPSVCRTSPNNIWRYFTAATIASPPSVVPGQLIQVTVTISFS